jgi:hypothetical protein
MVITLFKATNYAVGHLVYTNLRGNGGRNSTLIYNNDILEEKHFHKIGGGTQHRNCALIAFANARSVGPSHEPDTIICSP